MAEIWETCGKRAICLYEDGTAVGQEVMAPRFFKLTDFADWREARAWLHRRGRYVLTRDYDVAAGLEALTL